MCLKPRSIPGNMTVNMAEALPQWSGDARHPSEVCDGCTNQTHQGTASPGILPYYTVLTGCMMLNAKLFRIIPPTQPWKTKEQTKIEGKQRRKTQNMDFGQSDKLRNPVNWISDPRAGGVMIYQVSMFCWCFIPGKSLVYVSCMHPLGN